jgi:hypothetical protein
MPDNQFRRDASGRLCFEMFRVPSEVYPDIVGELRDTFGLMRATDLILGFSELIWDFRNDDALVGLEWDNWSGLIVAAKNESAERLVRVIGAYLLQSPWAREM